MDCHDGRSISPFALWQGVLTRIADWSGFLLVRSQAGLIQLRPKFFWLRDCRLAGEIAAHVHCSLPIHQPSILQQRDSWGLGAGRSQCYYLEGPVAIANDAQQGSRVSGIRITADGNLSRL